MIFPPIELNPDVPASALTKDRSVIPSQVRERYNRLTDYLSLYNGDMGPLLLYNRELREIYNRLTVVNYFGHLSDYYAKALMAVPPNWDEELGALLRPALHSVIVDVFRYGSGILLPRVENSRPVFERVDPRYYYRLVDGSQVVTTMLPSKRYRLQRFFTDRVSIWEGRLDDTDTMETMRHQATIAIPRGEDMLTICAMPPSDGDFSRSIFAKMAPLVLEIINRITRNAHILDVHSRPQVVAWLSGDEYNFRTREEDKKALEEERRRRWFGRRLFDNIVLSIAKYAKVEYLTWDGNLEASHKQISEIEQKLFFIADVPPVLQANLSNNPLPSGVALKRAYHQTYFFTLQLQGYLLDCVQQAVRNMNRIGGTAFAIPSSWENPFDHLANEEVDPNEGRGVMEVDDVNLL